MTQPRTKTIPKKMMTWFIESNHYNWMMQPQKRENPKGKKLYCQKAEKNTNFVLDSLKLFFFKFLLKNLKFYLHFVTVTDYSGRKTFSMGSGVTFKPLSHAWGSSLKLLCSHKTNSFIQPSVSFGPSFCDIEYGPRQI